jgi:sugar phosphate isomerase/epimerase
MEILEFHWDFQFEEYAVGAYSCQPKVLGHKSPADNIPERCREWTVLMVPKLAVCNFLSDVCALKRFAMMNGFSGVDWTLKVEDLPRSTADESPLLRQIAQLHPLEVRYHLAFNGTDLGDSEIGNAHRAMEIFRSACKLVSRLGGRYMTVHLGLGLDSTKGLSWERSLAALAALVDYGKELGVAVCLENLAWGWSSRPELFEKLVRKSRAGVTLDIGHAKVCSSVQSQAYTFEDFIAPHPDRVLNAHIYHEECEDRHLPPQQPNDLIDRLNVLSRLSCDWWVLELHEEPALLSTLGMVNEYLATVPTQGHLPFTPAPFVLPE